MNLTKYEKEKIFMYFNSHQVIESIRQRIQVIRREFYEGSTMASYTTRTELGLVSVGFNPENYVVDLVYRINIYERRIKNVSKKKMYFDRFLNSLDPDDKSYLIKRYTNNIPKTVIPLDVLAYEEILEIDKAIIYMNGYIPEEAIQIDLSNETLEDNFDELCAFLEV